MLPGFLAMIWFVDYTHNSSSQDAFIQILMPVFKFLTLYSHLSNQHLVDKYSEPPPVNCSGVWCVCQHFWGQELRGPTEGTSPVPKSHALEQEREVAWEIHHANTRIFSSYAAAGGQFTWWIMDTHLLYRDQSLLSSQNPLCPEAGCPV